MVSYELVGYRRVLSKKNGKSYVDLSFLFPSQGYEGMKAYDVFCEADIVQGDLIIGDRYLVFFQPNSSYAVSVQWSAPADAKK